MCTTALTAPVNRRRSSQWLQPHDLVTIASVYTCVCAYKTSGDDGRYGPTSIFVANINVVVSSMSSLSRCNTATTTSSTRHRQVVVIMSKRSHRRRVVVHVNVIVTTMALFHDDTS